MFREVPERVRELEAFVGQSHLVTQTKPSGERSILLLCLTVLSLSLFVVKNNPKRNTFPMNLDKWKHEMLSIAVRGAAFMLLCEREHLVREKGTLQFRIGGVLWGSRKSFELEECFSKA